MSPLFHPHEVKNSFSIELRLKKKKKLSARKSNHIVEFHGVKPKCPSSKTKQIERLLIIYVLY